MSQRNPGHCAPPWHPDGTCGCSYCEGWSDGIEVAERERDEALAKLAKARLSRAGYRGRARHLEIERDQWKARAHESDERAGEARAKLAMYEAMYEAMPVVPADPDYAGPFPYSEKRALWGHEWVAVAALAATVNDKADDWHSQDWGELLGQLQHEALEELRVDLGLDDIPGCSIWNRGCK